MIREVCVVDFVLITENYVSEVGGYLVQIQKPDPLELWHLTYQDWVILQKMKAISLNGLII